jgi:16S rRNA (uracil1498-N3)-methyltransferase
VAKIPNSNLQIPENCQASSFNDVAHRFYIAPEASLPGAKTLLLTGGEAQHALRVLRLRTGDSITVLNGAGHEFSCVIGPHDRAQAELRVNAHVFHPPPQAAITLLQALPKGKLIETIIQKATELGAARIVPLLTERVISHFDSDEAGHKGGKWQQVAIEAVKQCGAPWLPKVEPPVKLMEFLARKEPFELPLVGSLQPDSRHPREYFAAFQSRHSRMPASVCVFIGPEGDLSPAELAAIEAAGALPITLGPLTLRTDTAALYCLSVLNYELRSNQETFARRASEESQK